MSENFIKKDSALDISFIKYAIKHPELTKPISRGATLVYEDVSDPAYNRAARKLAREAIREGEKVFRAIKDGRRWRVEPVPANV